MPTIGVAVAIPEPWATQLQDYRTSVGDTMAATIPTHITLVPPTEVTEEQLARIEEHLTAAAEGTARFPVHLRGTGTFRPVERHVASRDQLGDCLPLSRPGCRPAQLDERVIDIEHGVIGTNRPAREHRRRPDIGEVVGDVGEVGPVVLGQLAHER